MIYEFEKTPLLKDVVLQVDRVGREITFRVAGPGSDLLASAMAQYFDWLNKQGPTATYGGSNVYSLYLPPIPSKAHSRMVEGFLHTFFLRNPTPQAVTISVTNKCQCACVHCSAALFSDSRPILSRREVERIVAESISLGVNNVTFTGGEPLLRKDLEAFVASVPPEKAVAQVFTNGIAMNARRAAALKTVGVYGIQISLDSPDPEEHDRLRERKGAFRAVEKGVKCALDAGLLVALSTYATRESVSQHKLSRIAELGAKWGVQEISVFDVIPTGRLLRRDDLLLDGESHTAIMDEALRLNKRHGGTPRVITQSWTNSGTGFARSFGCLAGNYQFHITAYGEVTPCDFTPLSFGNVRSEPVADLWKKITTHPAYCKHRDDCRMQSPAFRRQYIHSIPEQAALPFPIEELSVPTEIS